MAFEDQAQGLRDLMQKVQKKNNARVITVTSGKGGVGKSSFSVNLAISLARRGVRVLLIDADFGLANIDVMLGITVPYNLFQVISESMDVRKIIVEGMDGIKFISGGSGMNDLINLNVDQLNIILDNLLQLEDVADVFIFDTGAGVSDNIMRLINSSTETILVTTPEPTSIMDAYALIKAIGQNTDMPKIHLVMNKADTVIEANTMLESLSRIVLKYINLNISPLGYVLNDPFMTLAVKAQQPIVISYPKSEAAQCISAIADRYLDIPPTEQKGGGLRRFISKLLKR